MEDIARLMEPVVKRLLGEPNEKLSKKGELRYGTKGSLAIDLTKGTYYDHEAAQGGGVLDLIRREHNDPVQWLRDEGLLNDDDIVATFDYLDETGKLLFQVCRKATKGFVQRRPDGNGGWVYSLAEDKNRKLLTVRRVLYRLPELLAETGTVFVPEGEKHVDALRALGLRATTNPGGAGKWRPEYSEFLRGADVVILPDNDEPGAKHAEKVAIALQGIAARVCVLMLPGLGPKGDVINWLAAGGTKGQLLALVASAPLWEPDVGDDHDSINLEDFVAYLPEHRYIFEPTGALWPAASVNARLAPVDDQSASSWLDANARVEQMTWYPGLPTLIKGKLFSTDGAWIDRPGCTTYNLYRPPTIQPGDANKAEPWLNLVYEVFPKEASHIIRFLAHRRQRPEDKIDHMLVMGGPPGIGKDTIVVSMKQALGPWNLKEVTPGAVMDTWTGFLKSVVVLINELRDLGDSNRVSFYEATKWMLASPPATLPINEKHIKQYYVPNVCGVVATTNYKTDGLYLPADDRRHYVAWSPLEVSPRKASDWTDYYRWLEEEGAAHVVAYLDVLDLSDFDPKAPPEKTEAFWEIVNASRQPEESELSDLLAGFKGAAVTLDMMIKEAEAARWLYGGLAEFLKDRTKRRVISARMDKAGYTTVGNRDAKDRLWKLCGRRCVIYCPKDLTMAERHELVRDLLKATEGWEAPDPERLI